MIQTISSNVPFIYYLIWVRSWWLFRSWGRVGTTIGGNKVERCGSQAMAIEKFKELYLEKTGNHWEDRDNFQKQPNKFFPLEIDYGQVSIHIYLHCVRCQVMS